MIVIQFNNLRERKTLIKSTSLRPERVQIFKEPAKLLQHRNSGGNLDVFEV